MYLFFFCKFSLVSIQWGSRKNWRKPKTWKFQRRIWILRCARLTAVRLRLLKSRCLTVFKLKNKTSRESEKGWPDAGLFAQHSVRALTNVWHFKRHFLNVWKELNGYRRFTTFSYNLKNIFHRELTNEMHGFQKEECGW